MSFDNLGKLLAEKYPERFAAWVLGEVPESIQVLKTELSIEPIRADAVTLLQATHRILQLEFQTTWRSRPPMPIRLLDYWVRLYRLYQLPITQVVVVLLPPSADVIIETVFAVEKTRHEYQVIKMWEQDSAVFMDDLALLPFAVLAQTQQPEQLLKQVANRVAIICEDEQRQETSAYVQIMAGLKYSKDVIRRLFHEDFMKESVIYQEILEEGLETGLQQGLQRGEATILQKLLGLKLGTLSEAIIDRIAELPLNQLEALAEALLSFDSIDDLMFWLESQ